MTPVGRCQDGMVFILGRCPDGMVFILERCLDGMVFILGRCQDGMVYGDQASIDMSFLEPICELEILIISHKQIMCNPNTYIYSFSTVFFVNLYVNIVCKYICIVFLF